MFKDIDLDRGTEISNIESIKASIKNILSTEVGSAPGNPFFGSYLQKFVFGLIGPLEKELIKASVENSLELWEKRIKITEIEVVEDPDYNRVIISVKFEVVLNGEKMNEIAEVSIDK